MRKGRPPFRATGPFLCLLLLSCGTQTAPSAEENRQLDSAEALLNSAPAELDNIDAGELSQPERNTPADAE